jgi:hypothetical protein
MKPRLRAHVYRPDPDTGADHTGRLVCAVCGLPETHRAHTEPAVDEVSARMLGEGIGD